MPRELVFLGPRKIGYREYDERRLGPREIGVETIYSAISHGTEMNLYRGTAAQLKRSISEDKLFTDGEPFYKYPVCFGYEEVGRVTAVGPSVEGFSTGDVVTTAYGHRETAVMNVDTTAYLNVVPSSMKMEQAVFQSLGSVAL
ncbi:MAG: alcohol dehydrogenase catalytic domain-containing protein, partial [Candidatus Thorarchaeota archaeon]